MIHKHTQTTLCIGLLLQHVSICKHQLLDDDEKFLYPKNIISNTNTDVGLAGFLLWDSLYVTRLAHTGMSSRCVGANRVRTTDGGVETLVNI